MSSLFVLLFVATALATSPIRPPPRCPTGYELTCDDRCGRTCDDYYNPPTECPDVVCVTTSCVCDPKLGYYYDGDNCIPKEFCPNPYPLGCPVGQVKVCDTNCNRTCEDFYFPKKFCPDIVCVTTSCMCDPTQGYYLDTTKNICVYYTHCPKPKIC